MVNVMPQSIEACGHYAEGERASANATISVQSATTPIQEDAVTR